VSALDVEQFVDVPAAAEFRSGGTVNDWVQIAAQPSVLPVAESHPALGHITADTDNPACAESCSEELIATRLPLFAAGPVTTASRAWPVFRPSTPPNAASSCVASR
jgi:hypothetical protein